MKYTDIAAKTVPFRKYALFGGIFVLLFTVFLLISMIISKENSVKDRIGFDKIDYSVTFEMDGETVSYGNGTSSDIITLGGEIGQFARDFYALDLKEVKESPLTSTERTAKIYFDFFEITLSRGKDANGENACVLTYVHIKLLNSGIFVLDEKQCGQLFEDIDALFDYEDDAAEYDTSVIDDLTGGEYFKVEAVSRGKTYDTYAIFTEDDRAELMEWLRNIKYTPLDKTKLTLYEGKELYFYTETGVKKLTNVTARTADNRYISCVSVAANNGDHLYRIDYTGKNINYVMWGYNYIMSAEKILLRPEKYDGFTLTAGKKTAEYGSNAMESRTGMEGELHLVKYNLVRASGALCEQDSAPETAEEMRLDCHMGDKTDSIILSSGTYGVHKRYYVTVIVNAEHSNIEKGCYLYELCENNYTKIKDSAEVLL
ncbi:MAG: hypothetical protein ACI4J6_09220 [Oscillospiraceae bacterium]